MTDASAILRHQPQQGWLLLAGSWEAFATRPGAIEPLIISHQTADLELVSVRGDEVDEPFARLQLALEEMTGILAQTVSAETFWSPRASKGVPYRTIVLLGEIPAFVVSEGDRTGLFSPQFQDAIVLAAGASADAVGAWMTTGGGEPLPGLNLLEHALVLSETTDVGRARQASELLQSSRVQYLLALPTDAAIHLGPEGAVRVIGDPPPKITFSSWQQS